MNESYWMGVLSVPALILGAAGLWLAVKAVGKIGERLLVGGIQHLGKGARESQRAGTASVVYGAEHSWMVAGGDVACIFLVGMKPAEVSKAAERLRPKVSLRDITKPPGERSRP